MIIIQGEILKVYIFSKDLSEQSQRQMKTVISYIDCEELYLDICWKSIFKNSKVKFKSFDELVKRKEKFVVIYFNIIDGLKLWKFREKDYIKFAFRPRGILPEESYYRNKSKIKKYLLNLIEKIIIKQSNYFIFLNENQKNHFLSKYSSFINNEKTYILPNVKQKNEAIFEENHSKKLNIVYSGGFSKWQNIDSIFRFVSKIIKHSSIQIKFTVLTFEKNHDKAQEYANEFGILKQTDIKYVKVNSLDKELRKHDIGIIIRDNNVVNVASSPFKIIDYISNGLAMIVTDSISNQTLKFIEKKFVYIINYDKDVINYSINDLVDFLRFIKFNKKKREIITTYFDSIEKIRKIKFI